MLPYYTVRCTNLPFCVEQSKSHMLLQYEVQSTVRRALGVMGVMEVMGAFQVLT